MHTVAHVPPFTFSYQCGSTLLVAYIPVNMYSAILQILLDILRGWIIFHLDANDIPAFIRRFLHRHLSVSYLISESMNNLVLLLSFGISSPILSFSLLLSQWVDVSFWLILIGKSVLDVGASKVTKRNQMSGQLYRQLF